MQERRDGDCILIPALLGEMAKMESPIRNCIETAKPYILNCAEDAEKEYRKMQEEIDFLRKIADVRQKQIDDMKAVLVRVVDYNNFLQTVGVGMEGVLLDDIEGFI